MATLLIPLLLLLGYVSVWALIATAKKRADLADIAWGIGFSLLAWSSFLLSPFSYTSLTLNLMVTLWSLRLSIHIARRNRNRKEDFRYENLKKNWGKHFRLRMFFQVFLLQGVIQYIVALPILWINTHPEILQFDALKLGVPLWFLGFLMETVADYQLSEFQKNPSNRGKLLTTGLWGWVRHPNYLGELIQWWVFWALSANFFLLMSPLLISFLIIKISGIAPLEAKMKHHPDFPKYAAATPSLVPFSMVNGAIYTIGWFIIVYFGGKNALLPLLAFIATYPLQLFLFSKFDRKSLLISPILSIYALFLGLIQETLFIHFNLLHYSSPFPPLWLLSLYPLFALTLNSSLSFINKYLPLSFCLGGIGAILSYLYGQRVGSVLILSNLSYLAIFLSWGLFLVILLLLNRALNRISEKYSSPSRLESPLTVFFDKNCPVCSLEMKKLQERNQTGKVIYDCLSSKEAFQKKVPQISYESAMKKILAINGDGEIFRGIDALSEIYARTDLSWIAILLQAPGFRLISLLAYAIWAKFR